MKREDYATSSSGRVVRAGPANAPFWAFVPHPLPPTLDPDRELTRVLADASYALGELAALGRMMSNPHLLINPFIRREAVLSSRIEGTQASIADVYAYEAGQGHLLGKEGGTPEHDVREVVNYVAALEYGLERLSTLPVSLRLIRELHERLLTGVRGEQATPGRFRTSQNWIGPPGCSLADATYVPPPVPEMHDALDALEKYVHAEDDNVPLMRLALIHYQFEAIHPFLDGNGRIGRLLITLLLVSWNLLSVPLLYLSAYFEKNRNQYYERLLGVSQRGEWRAWVRFFLEGVADQARDAVVRAKQLQDLQSEWRTRLATMHASARALRLVDELFDLPVLTIPQAQRVLGVTYHAAQGNIEKLVQAGILRLAEDSRYGRTYVAHDIMQIVAGTD